MSHPFRRQPLKFLYMTYLISSTLFIRLPVWFIKFAFLPRTRPRQSWSVGRSISVKLLQMVQIMVYQTGIQIASAVDPQEVPKNPEKIGYMVVEPVGGEFIRGEIATLAAVNGVEPSRIAGYWFGVRGPDGKAGQKAGLNEKVVYYFHGGGYISSSVIGHAPICRDIVQHCSATGITRLFSLEYRISSALPFKVENPFPAALIDAVAGYYYLIKSVGFNPENIIIGGDSAGGHLVLSLTRYLQQELQSALPLPKALLLISPYVDLGDMNDSPTSSMVTNRESDMCYEFLYGGYPTRAFLGKMSPDAVQLNPYLSPASLKLPNPEGLFKGFPTTYLLAGEAETLRDSIHTLRDRMSADIGEEQVTYVEKDAYHDFVLFSWFEPEKTEAWIEISEWVRTLWI